MTKPDFSPAAQNSPGPRPLLQLPFACGTRVRLNTYIGHDDYQIDMRPRRARPY
jgi:hypothetical protein